MLCDGGPIIMAPIPMPSRLKGLREEEPLANDFLSDSSST